MISVDGKRQGAPLDVNAPPISGPAIAAIP